MKTRLALLALASMVLASFAQLKPASRRPTGNPRPPTRRANSIPRSTLKGASAPALSRRRPRASCSSFWVAQIPPDEGEDGAWAGVTRPQDEGFHYYQLVIDGAGVPDPGSLYFYGGNRWGSGVEVPAQDQDFYAVKDVPHGQLRQTLYFSTNSNAMLRCFVYTPPDYDKDLTRRYPVSLSPTRGGEDETGWGSQGHAGLIMDNLIAEGKAKPFIIVMANSYVPGAGGPGRGPAAAPNK